MQLRIMLNYKMTSHDRTKNNGSRFTRIRTSRNNTPILSEIEQNILEHKKQAE